LIASALTKAQEAVNRRCPDTAHQKYQVRRKVNERSAIVCVYRSRIWAILIATPSFLRPGGAAEANNQRCCNNEKTVHAGWLWSAFGTSFQASQEILTVNETQSLGMAWSRKAKTPLKCGVFVFPI
jgi:hypothetical protein